MLTRVPPFAGASVESIPHLRAAAAARLTGFCRQHDPSGRLVHLLPYDVGCELQRYRAEPDAHLHLPRALVDDLDQLGAGHAGEDARDVGE